MRATSPVSGHRITEIAFRQIACVAFFDGNSLLGHETMAVAIRFAENL